MKNVFDKPILLDVLQYCEIERVIEKELPESSKESLIVLDAETGQNAISQVKAFKETTNIN